MGLCASKTTDEYLIATEKIERSGESGKSTIVKQMKIMYQNGFTENERRAFVPIIHRNILESAQELAYGFKVCEISPTNPENSNFVDNMSAVDVDSIMQVELSDYIVNGMSRLWSDPSVENLLKNTNKFYLMDSALYLFQNASRIYYDPDYIPTDNDILRSRSKTTGIIETRFPMGNKTIHMFDVGGQRSERKKWIHCFEDVTSILFCVAISEYDQVLLEEYRHNRMDESLQLFSNIVNSKWFLRSSIILFLNKIDVFKEKIVKSPLENIYPEYKGGDDVSLAAKFILWKFQSYNTLGLPLYPQ
ncbi:hypothetical protein BB561_002914 [Smittium simulii]|uniref:Guanine nucleotide-binding protein subunit alpha n=1 Tax=Smittium simulii TaxID=133385 RepID=A0A2T9YNQ6_9FUNG|nr:hypothetical protein BB561_002914 [Smittium simulii]